jgi:hypothetical protein
VQTQGTAGFFYLLTQVTEGGDFKTVQFEQFHPGNHFIQLFDNFRIGHRNKGLQVNRPILLMVAFRNKTRLF